jgi:Trypsin-like peptidase domain
MQSSSDFRFGLPGLLVASITLMPRMGLALEAHEIFKMVEPSIVVVRVSIRDGEATASGVLLTSLDFVTNCHVVEKANKIIVDQGNVRRSARIRFQDSGRDLCQLKLDDTFPNGKPIIDTVASKDLEVGQPVFAVGSPRGLERTISRGIVSGLREEKGETGRLVQTDAAISPGSSGGGLFDNLGRLVGITTLSFRDSQNLNFAIPAEWIAELPSRNRDRFPESTPGTPGKSQGATGNSRDDAQSLSSWLPRVGDRALYRIGLGKIPRFRDTLVVEITGVSEKAVIERISILKNRTWSAKREIETGFDPTKFIPLVVLPGTFQLAEISPYISPSEPLVAGMQWKDVQGEFAINMKPNRSVLSTVTVVGREKLVVPAGKFDTWKIQSIATTEGWNGGTLTIRCQFWISPDTKRTVKFSVFQEWNADSISSYETYELLGYEAVN